MFWTANPATSWRTRSSREDLDAFPSDSNRAPLPRQASLFLMTQRRRRPLEGLDHLDALARYGVLIGAGVGGYAASTTSTCTHRKFGMSPPNTIPLCDWSTLLGARIVALFRSSFTTAKRERPLEHNEGRRLGVRYWGAPLLAGVSSTLTNLRFCTRPSSIENALQLP